PPDLSGLVLVCFLFPEVRTKHGEAAFSFSAPQVWNKLPEDLRSAPTLNSFKTRLKTFLFNIAFN
ncbi:hypothetical protein LDENG_00161870, partial [Lucifuga dentata]